MNKPANYDSISLHRDPVKLGGHIAVIKQVTEAMSKSGKEQIIIYIDFDQQDDQAGYFKSIYDADTRKEKKWPNDATYRITNTRQDMFDRGLKQFVTAFEDTNGVTAIWGDKWAAQFKGKKIGVVFGEEEDKWNEELIPKRRIRFFCDAHTALDQDVPKKKYYKGEVGTQTTDLAATASEGSLDFPDNGDEGLPFA